MDWSPQRMSEASIAPRIDQYEAIPQTYHESRVKETNPELFTFETVSVGDSGGQLFFVPLDESSKQNAEFILEAIKFYVDNNRGETK